MREMKKQDWGEINPRKAAVIKFLYREAPTILMIVLISYSMGSYTDELRQVKANVVQMQERLEQIDDTVRELVELRRECEREMEWEK